MFTLSRSHCQTLSIKSKGTKLGKEEKKIHKVSHWLHSVCIWPHFRYITISLFSGNLEHMSVQISPAWKKQKYSFFLYIFRHSQTNHSFIWVLHRTPVDSHRGSTRGHPITAAFFERWREIVWTTHTVTDGINGYVWRKHAKTDDWMSVI